MRTRLVVAGILVLLNVLWLLATSVSATDTPDYAIYIVQGGKTLQDIAREVKVPLAVLANFNKVTNVRAPLQSGQVILVPVMPEVAPVAETPKAEGTPAPTPPPAQPVEQVPTTPAQQTGPQVSAPPPPLGPDEMLATVGMVSAEYGVIRSEPGAGREWYKAKRGESLVVLGQSKDGRYYAILMEKNNPPGWIASSDVSLTQEKRRVPKQVKEPAASQENGGAGEGRQDIISTASTFLGMPYKLPPTYPYNVDCSLFVQLVFARHGIGLPRTADEQSHVGAPVDMANLLPGDRLSFWDRNGKYIGHTGIYIGGNRFIHASSGHGKVTISDLDDRVYGDSTYRRECASVHRDW